MHRTSSSLVPGTLCYQSLTRSDELLFHRAQTPRGTTAVQHVALIASQAYDVDAGRAIPPSAASGTPQSIAALAKRRLADEVDLAQDRGELLKDGQRKAAVPNANSSDEIALSRKEIRIRAERRLGELLKETPLTHGARGIGTSEVPKENPTLSDLGVSKKLSSKAQQLADWEEDEFEEAIGEWKEKAKTSDRVTVDLAAPS